MAKGDKQRRKHGFCKGHRRHVSTGMETSAVSTTPVKYVRPSRDVFEIVAKTEPGITTHQLSSQTTDVRLLRPTQSMPTQVDLCADNISYSR